MKLTKHYQDIYNEYEKREFPLVLLGRHGWETFNTKQELFKFYLDLSNLDRKNNAGEIQCV